jgi:hypothetical protein
MEVRKQYRFGITNRFAVLENLNDSKDISRAWEKVKDNVKPLLMRVWVCTN